MVSILLIDDDKDATSELAQILTALLAAEVVVANGVQEAKSVMQESRFDVCVVDFTLPDGTALDLVQSVSAATTVRFLWSGDVIAAELKFRDLPGWRFLPKPLDVERLVGMITDTMASVRPSEKPVVPSSNTARRPSLTQDEEETK